MRETIDVTANADDVAAIWNFRETLLAQNWPDSKTVGRNFGSSFGASAESEANREREREGSPIFGVWAGATVAVTATRLSSS